jgi:hypothetical protein
MRLSISSYVSPAQRVTGPRARGRCAQLFQQLIRELQPVGVAEQLAIADIARHAVRLEHYANAADDGQSFDSKAIVEYLISGEASEFNIDNLSAAAEHALNRRQLVLHSRAFQQALRLFLKLQTRRSACEQRAVGECFVTENACVQHLAAHQQRNFACASCGAREAFFIQVRRCLECKHCHSQLGLRSGTVMANSSLPLRTWFLAINFVLQDPMISTVRAGAILRLRRAGTTRLVIQKIRQAIFSDQRTQLLAGLDQCLSQPEPSDHYLSQVSSQSAAVRASAECLDLIAEPTVMSMSLPRPSPEDLSYVSSFFFPAIPRKESRMSDEPLNLPGPEPERNSDSQPEAQSTPKSKNSKRYFSEADCIALLSRLPMLLNLGLMKTADVHATRSVLHEILAYHERAGGPQAGPDVDRGLLEQLRKNPQLANLFAPISAKIKPRNSCGM